MILSDIDIIKLGDTMISPFFPGQVSAAASGKLISFGTSSYGYDARLSPEFKVAANISGNKIIDPKAIDEDVYVDVISDHCIIPPHSFVLGRTLEYFRIPRDILCLCIGKSTYARCGIIVNVTPLEPEWEGNVTIEISNTTPFPAKIYAHEGICQFIFLRGDGCGMSYADRKGKYQRQHGIVLPR